MISIVLLALLVTADDPAIDEVLAKARADLERGRLESPIATLAPHAVEQAPQVGALFLEVLRRSQRFEEGRTYLARIEDRAGESTELLIAIAQWEAEEGWVRRAAERLSSASKLQPENPDLWAARARLSWSLGDARNALDATDRSIANGRDPLELAWLRGRALRELGEGTAAEETLTALLAAHPGHLGARLTLARCARARGDRATAIERLWEILERDPDHATALGELGALLARVPAMRDRGFRALERFHSIRDRRERIERLTRERREGRDSEAIRTELATALREDGRPALAIPVARGCARGSAGQLELARALVALGRAAEAIPLFAEVLRSDPTRDDVRLELADALLARGDVAAARTVLEHLRTDVSTVERGLIEVECRARLVRDPEQILAPLIALLDRPDRTLELFRAAVDAASAFDQIEALVPELDRLHAAEPSAPGPLLGRVWVELERGGDVGPWESALHSVGDTCAEAWTALAQLAARRGDSEGESRARREARRTRALCGPADD